MCTASTTYLAIEPKSGPSLMSLWILLVKLPEELIMEILSYVLSFPGSIAKPQFQDGLCEWPSCHCRCGVWHHIPVKQLTSETLTPLLLEAPEPVPRLAEYTFYTNNTFHCCGPQHDSDGTWDGFGFWLPPTRIRHWIRRLEIEIEIALPRLNQGTLPEETQVLSPGPARNWQFLQKLQQGVHGFTTLRSLRVMFEALFVTEDENLHMLDKQLGSIEPFFFQTQELIVYACSVEPDDDCITGDILFDERLGKILEKYMSATSSSEAAKVGSGHYQRVGA